MSLPNTVHSQSIQSERTWKRQQIFVFDSNLAGRHGAGSALAAKLYHGARIGVGDGPAGNSYAIPTKNCRMNVMPINEIKIYVDTFLRYAEQNPHLDFNVVKIGTGLAEYSDEEMASLFAQRPANVYLHQDWSEFLSAESVL